MRCATGCSPSLLIFCPFRAMQPWQQFATPYSVPRTCRPLPIAYCLLPAGSFLFSQHLYFYSRLLCHSPHRSVVLCSNIEPLEGSVTSVRCATGCSPSLLIFCPFRAMQPWQQFATPYSVPTGAVAHCFLPIASCYCLLPIACRFNFYLANICISTRRLLCHSPHRSVVRCSNIEPLQGSVTFVRCATGCSPSLLIFCPFRAMQPWQQFATPYSVPRTCRPLPIAYCLLPAGSFLFSQHLYFYSPSVVSLTASFGSSMQQY